MTKITRILMVDDDEDDRLLFSHAIKVIDPSIYSYEADNFPAAVEWLNTQLKLPDIIFLDLNMPPMGGFECLHIIRNNSDLAYIPIIIYSTSGYYSDIEKAQKIGANGYFKKPNDYEHLCAKLEKLLKHQCTEGINPLLCAKLKKLMNGECGGECLAMPSFKFLIT